MLEDIFEQQKAFFKTGRSLPYAFRINQLKQLGKVIESAEKNILKALYEDLKRPSYEAYASENAYILSEIKYVVKHLHRWMKRQRVRTPLYGFPGRSFIYPEPYGICGIFSPWNYPFQITFAPLIGSIAAGNCSILKPSEMSPSSSSVIKHLISNNFDPSYIACYTGGREVSESLLKGPLDFIFFTGSTRVGSIVMQAAARRLIPVVLELGGKSPCLLTDDIPMELCVRRIMWGKFFNAGQTCIAPDYVLLPGNKVDEFLEAAQRVLKNFYGFEPQKSPDYARIINHEHFDRLTELASSSSCVVGGQTDRDDLYIAPSLFYPVQWDDDLMKEEIFGPLLPVVTYDSLDDCLDHLQCKPNPLSLYIFSNSQQIIEKILRQISAGGVGVNDTLIHVSSPYLPFGGVGSSGIGRYHGWYSFEAFSHFKPVLKRSFHLDFTMKYPPNSISFDRFKKIVRFLFRI